MSENLKRDCGPRPDVANGNKAKNLNDFPLFRAVLTFVSLVCCVGRAAVGGLTGCLRTEKWN